MKHLVKFNINRKFKSKITIVVNILQIIVIFFAFHIDYFFQQDLVVKKIYLDDTTGQYLNYFLEDNGSQFDYYIDYGQADEKSVILHYDDGFYIISNNGIDEKTVKEIENDLKRVLRKNYLSHHKFLEEYANEYQDIELTCINKDEKNTDLLSILITIVYFLILSYGTLISNEAIYEKGSRILEILLTNITIEEYFKSKILTGYLIPLIQFGFTGIYVLINFLIRYRQDKMMGLIGVIDITQNDMSIPGEISITDILLSILVILLTLITIQVILLFVTAKFTSPEDANGMQSLVYVLMLVFYYLMMIYLDERTINSKIFIFLSYCPLLSSVLMSYRIITGTASVIDVVICTIFSIVVLFGVIFVCMPKYKYNILNYSSDKSSHLEKKL